jgi:hypothetical protein
MTSSGRRQSLVEEDPDYDDFSPCSISYYHSEVEPPVVYNRSEFKQLQEAKRRQEVNRKIKIVHWDPISGANFDSAQQKGFPFERIETLFDHQNIYFNVQKTDFVRR